MATTPVTRVTDLARRWRVDIDTAVYPASAYNQLLGVEEAKLVEELRTVSDEVYEDLGAMREATTGYSWRIELKLKLSTNLAGTSRDAVHAFLRGKYVAMRATSAALNEFGVRVYDRNGLAGEASEGRAYVKTWGFAGGSSQESMTVVLQGQGALTEITNPASSQVPAVSSVTPTGGGVAGGTLVNIYGNHFTGATAVAFGVTAASAFTVISDSLVVAVAPAHAAGSVQTKVTTSAGASADTAADDFLYA